MPRPKRHGNTVTHSADSSSPPPPGGSNPSLARSEAAELFHLIAENVQQVFFLMSADCRQMLYMSPAFERVWQMPREAVYRDALCWLERIHPDDLWLFDPTSREAPLARSPQHEYRLVMPDGSIRWVLMQTIPVNDATGALSRVVGILSDVTERRQHEADLARSRDEAEALVRHRTRELLAANEDLLASEARFRTLTETVPVAIFIEHRAQVIYANPAAYRLTGHTPDELPTLDLAARLTAGAVRTPAHDAGDALDTAHGVDVEFTRANGEARVLHVSRSRVTFEQRDCVLLAAIDVTAPRRAERALREHRASVARVAHLSTLEGFASSLSHELNQPLSAIVSYARALQNRAERGPVDADFLRQGLDRVAGQAMRAGELMRRLRNFVVRGEIQRRDVDLDQVTREAARSLSDLATDRGVTLTLALEGSLPAVTGDPLHLEIAVTNLLKNAIEAVADGAASDRCVVAVTSSVDGRVHLEVRDRGPGVPPRIAASLFEPLVSTKHGGMGVGLAITRSIVEAHRGTIALSSGEGPGAIFRIELPVAGGAL
jgi:two-component system, LuxR family, sensor kinase FixL